MSQPALPCVRDAAYLQCSLVDIRELCARQPLVRQLAHTGQPQHEPCQPSPACLSAARATLAYRMLRAPPRLCLGACVRARVRARVRWDEAVPSLAIRNETSNDAAGSISGQPSIVPPMRTERGCFTLRGAR